MMDGTQSPSSKDAREGVLKNIDAHHSSLSSHLLLVESLQSNATAQAVSQILDSAKKLVDQFARLRKQLVSSGIDTSAENPRTKARAPRVPNKINGNPRVAAANSANSTGIPGQEGGGRKRPWDNDLPEEQESSIDYTYNQSSRKRPRTKRRVSGERDDVEDFVPVALEKDDISEEVERRLKLREERRKKLNAEPEKKRKRDSASSNNGVAKARMKRSKE